MKNKIFIFKSSLFIFLTFVYSSAYAAVIRVPSDYPTIQEAINIAVAGDTVLVSDGTYTGDGNKNLDFGGKAITVQSENGPETAIIDCQGQGRGFYFHNGEGFDSKLEGFTVSNGYVTGIWPQDSGGAILCDSASPTITNCIISGNSAGLLGGGICLISSFSSISNGAITNNTASRGGGIYSEYSCAAIKDCNILGNFGGGIVCGFSSLTLTNCLIAKNRAVSSGGGLSIVSSTLTITNCTISRNEASSGGGISGSYSTPILTNCILWNNSPDEIYKDEYSFPIITYSNIQGGYSGEGNINADPLFIDPNTDNYALGLGSPCINAGDLYSRFDLDLSINDMGVFGGKGELPNGVIGGAISGVLPVSGSPYIIGEDLIVGVQDTLTIEPGVILQMHNHSGIFVYGEINAQGTAESIISLTRFQPWDKGGGIKFVKGSGQLSYCKIEYCENAEGGGIYCYYSSPAIANCTITENRGSFQGAGIHCYYSSPYIMNCVISNNITGSGSGGGIKCYESSPTIKGCAITQNSRAGIICYSHSNPLIKDCTISQNEVFGINCTSSSPVIEHCLISENTYGGIALTTNCSGSITNSTISGNIAENGSGGGIACYFNSNPTIANCLISLNIAQRPLGGDGGGGGIFCQDSAPVITDCIITRNTAINCFGGGIMCFRSPAVITNCVIAGNIASGNTAEGGAIASSYYNPIITNCSISGNYTEYGYGGGLYCNFGSAPNVINSILWGDSPREIYIKSGAAVVTYSDTKGGWIGQGNINIDPLFIDPARGDFHLQINSPCIDTADPNSLNIPWGGARRDMGAYEYDQGWYNAGGGHIIPKPIAVYKGTLAAIKDN